MTQLLDPDVPVIVHQSDLGSWNYCPARLGYEREAQMGSGMPSDQTSRSAYGSVLHHAMHVLERDGDLDRAIQTFLYYWHPLNIEAICPPVPRDGWMGYDSYGEMRKRGVDTLRKYADLMRYDDHELLALEYEFLVPLRGTNLWLAGTVDRLAVRWYRRYETVCIDDYKTGQQKWNLRWNVQGTAYAYASLQPEFWLGAEGEFQRLTGERRHYKSAGFTRQDPLEDGFETRGHELNARFEEAPRRFTWINLKDFKIVDGGWRGPQDYERLKLAAQQVTASVNAGIFPLRLDGETCKFCTFRRTCGGVGLPDDEHGDPAYRYMPEFKS